VASANPEDYTNRGRIITPLKDRFGAEIRTHYPTTIEDEIAVIRQEADLVADVPGRADRDPGPLHPQPARQSSRSTSAPA
jgi:Mg-chelatase subunit ChlI